MMKEYRKEYFYIPTKDRKSAGFVYKDLKKKYKIKKIYNNREEHSIEYILTDYKKFISLISKNTLEYLKDTYKDVTYISATEIKIGEL